MATDTPVMYTSARTRRGQGPVHQVPSPGDPVVERACVAGSLRRLSGGIAGFRGSRPCAARPWVKAGKPCQRVQARQGIGRDQGEHEECQNDGRLGQDDPTGRLLAEEHQQDDKLSRMAVARVASTRI